MTVGFDAPLPPARTGVADYAVALLGALRRRGSVEINPAQADVRLYHLGNNQLHREIYRRAIAQPGVVVLHDAVLQHFFLGSLEERQYVEEFVYNYGEWNRDLAGELWRDRASSSLDSRYFAYPMLRRIGEISRAVVVHNPAAGRMLRRHAPAANIVEIPHLLAPAPSPSPGEILEFREKSGLAPCQFVAGVFGYLRESKRLMNVLRGFGTVRQSVPGAALLVAGDFVSQDLARAAEPFLGCDGVIRLRHLAERDFWLAASAVDVCINLRDPAAGETSGIAVRMMGLSKPVLLTAGEETSRYPETACFRIEPGPTERASLIEHVILAASSPETALEIGRRGAEHVNRYHSLDRVADEYWKTLCAHAS